MTRCRVCNARTPHGSARGTAGDRCRECVRVGRTSSSNVCVCDVPRPETVYLWGTILLAGTLQCGRCGRKVVGTDT